MLKENKLIASDGNFAEKLVDDLKLREEARKISIKESAVSGFSSGVGDNYVTLFGLALNANATQIGFLSAFPGLLSPISQFFGSKLMEKQPRQKIVAKYVLMQALMWIPIAILGILFWKLIAIRSLPWLLIFLYSILAIVGGLIGPAWFSWMGDIVPAEERGKYFGRRNKIAHGSSIIAILIGSIVLDRFATHGLAVIGFAILFSAAFISRIMAYFYLKKQHEPKLELKKDYYFSFWAFLKKYTNFTKFTIYIALFNLALAIASPFFTVYMKENLGLSYIMIMIVNMSMLAFILLFNPLVGKFSDKYGNLKLMYMGSFLLALYPVGWIFIKNPILLIAIVQLIGGYIIDNINVTFMRPILIVFVISAMGRFVAPTFFLPKIKELRKFQEFPFSTYMSYPATAVMRLTRQFVHTSYSKKKD